MWRPRWPGLDREAAVAGLLTGGVAFALGMATRGWAGDEEVGHFLAARYALAQPELFLGTGSRPLVTLGFSLPAQVGLWAARTVAALLTALTAYAVARIVRRAGWIHPAWGGAFLLVQPFFASNAGAVMTEPWAAALMAWGHLALVERRNRLVAGIAALLPLVRMETMVFWPLLALFLVRRRAARSLWLLPLPILLWNALGALGSGDPLWLLHQSSWQAYPQRDPLHYLRSFVWITGLGLFVPVIAGWAEGWVRVRESLRRLGGKKRRPEDIGPDAAAARDALVVAGIVVVVFLAVYTALAVWHPVTFGNLRYFAYAAPSIAVLAAAGTRLILDRPRLRTAVALAVALLGAALAWNHPIIRSFGIMVRWDPLPVLVAGSWVAVAFLPRPVRRAAPFWAVAIGVVDLLARHGSLFPLTPSPEHAAIRESAALYRHAIPEGGRLYAAHPLLAYHLEKNPYDPEAWPPVTDRTLALAPTGSFFFWESHYTPTRGASLFLSSVAEDSTWRYGAGTIAADSSWAGAYYVRVGKPVPAPGDSTAAAGDGTTEDALARSRAMARAAVEASGLPERAWLVAAQRVEAAIPARRADAEADPKNPEAWLVLAQRYSAAGMVSEAWDALGRAERLAPDNPYNLAFRAELLRHRKDLTGALKAAQRALAMEPGDPVFHYLNGRLLLELHRLDEGARELVVAADRLPKRWDIQYLAGKARYDQKRYAQAEPYLDAALALRPQHADAAIKLAEIAWRLGRREDSVTRLRDFIRRRPEIAAPYLVLGDLLVLLGRKDEAEATWREGMQKTGGDPRIASRLRPHGGSTSGQPN